MTNTSANKDQASSGDPIPPTCAVIEVHLGELKQLFDAIDPSPFRDRDLDPREEEFIVGWAKDLPRDVQFVLLVDLDREAGIPDEAAVLRLPSGKVKAVEFLRSKRTIPFRLDGPVLRFTVPRVDDYEIAAVTVG